MVKSKLPPQSGSSLKAVEIKKKKGDIKFFKSLFSDVLHVCTKCIMNEVLIKLLSYFGQASSFRIFRYGCCKDLFHKSYLSYIFCFAIHSWRVSTNR